MPNRIIKESIQISRTVNEMTDFQFRVWVHLITYVDDFGRGSADPEILKGRVFPRRKRLSERELSQALADLAGIGCIRLYEVDGEPYLCFPNWGEHQRIRSSVAKFPAPPEDDDLPQSAADCGELPRVAASCGELRRVAARIQNPESRIQNPEYFCAEQTPGVSSAPAAITLPLVDKTEYPVTAEQCQEWAGLYPAVDVMQQLRAMKGWLDANPKNRKTKTGILRFINGWLSREQNRARPDMPKNAAQAPEAQQKMRKLEPRDIGAVPPPPEMAAVFFPAPKPDRAEQDEAAAEARRAAALRALEGGNA